jgi:hypothetical protein
LEDHRDVIWSFCETLPTGGLIKSENIRLCHELNANGKATKLSHCQSTTVSVAASRIAHRIKPEPFDHALDKSHSIFLLRAVKLSGVLYGRFQVFVFGKLVAANRNKRDK